jgi:hypothetical protein
LELPGPSQGGTLEIVKPLGSNPWSFADIQSVHEAVKGGKVTGTFDAVATTGQVFKLAFAFLQLPPS